MAFNIEVSEDRRSLLMSGNLKVDQAVEIRDRLLAALESLKEVRVVIDKEASLDLAALQLICALHREAMLRGIPSGPTEGLSGPVLKAVSSVGFVRKRCCRICPGGTCHFVPDGEAA